MAFWNQIKIISSRCNGRNLSCLKNLGAEWAKPTEEELWTIRVRWKYDTSAQFECGSAPNLMKMQINYSNWNQITI